MFSTLGLFKQVPCPSLSGCSSEICLFSHNLKRTKDKVEEEPPLKKQKLTLLQNPGHASSSADPTESIAVTTPEKGDLGVPGIENPPIALKSGLVKPVPTAIPQSTTLIPKTINSSKAKIVTENETRTTRSATPSLVSVMEAAQANRRILTPIKATQKELLQPRKMANPPATHPVRFKLLLLMHEQSSRLNKLLAASTEPSKDTLVLSNQELITMSLDEEQANATSNPKVYANVMKNRIGALKKSGLKAWIVERNIRVQKKLEQEQGTRKRKLESVNERVKTGLTYEQEIQVLPYLMSTIDILKKHSYVTAIPTEAEVDKACAGVSTAKGWEICDRCSCRFRAFQTRQEDGTITTGGSCRHHWGRLGPQPRGTGAKPIYSCCQLEQDQPGCEEKPSHVFKITNPQRLATILQFEPAPELSLETDLQPVCFDCEMGYTSVGMELIRLTAVAWPSGDALLDVLVRPKGEILDLNTRFSGVSIEQWTKAKPWNSVNLPPLSNSDETKRQKVDANPATSGSSKLDSAPLAIVSSVTHARSLLFRLVGPTTPLMGHALENDLIAVRTVHPSVIDTVILYPHRRGLPMKNKLKFLARDEIQWTIQDSGSDGHDSLEDALAAGELIRHKVKVKWEEMRRAGWSFDGDKLESPESCTQTYS